MPCLCSCSSWGWACQGPKHVEDSSVTYMLLLNCALKMVEEIILCRSCFNVNFNILLKQLYRASVGKWKNLTALMSFTYFQHVTSLRFIVRDSLFWTKHYLPCRVTYLFNTTFNVECSYISFSQSSFYEFRTVSYTITALTNVFKLCKLKPDWSVVELNSKALCIVPRRMSSVTVRCLKLDFPTLLPYNDCFWNPKFRDFLEN